MRVQLRIVAGSLRGRKLSYIVNANLRPAPQMVREALFSILGDAVPDRPFYDLFAGTGAVGVEALSRGGHPVIFVERDFRVGGEIERHLRAFGVADRAAVIKADAYRWAERWRGSSEPVNIFVGPPFPDFERRFDELLMLVADLQRKVNAGSVLVLQSERSFEVDKLPAAADWDQRSYGRNRLLLWVKEADDTAGESESGRVRGSESGTS